MNASGGSEAAVTTITRIGWIKFRECGELLYGRKFLLKMKGRIDQSCIKSAMLYGSKTWCLRENEMAILRRIKKAMTRAMCEVKLIEKRSQEPKKFAGLQGYFVWISQDEWSAMVWACFEKGYKVIF